MTLGAVWWADGAWRVRSEPLPLLTPESEAQRTDPIPTVEAGQTVAIRAQGTERLTTLDAYAGLADQVHVNGQLVEAVFLPDQRDSTFGAVAVRGWGSQEVQLPLSAPLALLRFAPGCCSRVAGRSGSLMCLLTRTRAQDDDAFGCADARSLHFSRGETRMSGSLQRLEVLLVGVMMVVAGAVVAVLLYVRPPAQQSYASATAVPVSTAAPTTSVAPATPETNRPTNPAPTPTTATPVVQADEAIASIVPASLIQTAWPLLLVASGALGLAFVLAHRSSASHGLHRPECRDAARRSGCRDAGCQPACDAHAPRAGRADGRSRCRCWPRTSVALAPGTTASAPEAQAANR
jgi:hypothetical protein